MSTKYGCFPYQTVYKYEYVQSSVALFLTGNCRLRGFVVLHVLVPRHIPELYFKTASTRSLPTSSFRVAIRKQAADVNSFRRENGTTLPEGYSDLLGSQSVLHGHLQLQAVPASLQLT
jgi:hypothetical protein